MFVQKVNSSYFTPDTGKLTSSSAYSGLHMALCAVNLAECAEEKIPASTMAEIHLTAAVGLKTRCGGKLGFLAVSASPFLPHSTSQQHLDQGRPPDLAVVVQLGGHI